jgi:transposase
VTIHIETEKVSQFEVCPRCATPSGSVYDHRVVVVTDAPLRDRRVRLHVRKRRFACRNCRKPFTEPVPGVRKGARTTERFQRFIFWACENLCDLKAVRRAGHCSSGFVYVTYYRYLELKRRQRLYPWPKNIGIDEHFFRRNPKHGLRDFVSIIVDFKGRRLMEVVEGRTADELEAALAYIPERENVRCVALDLCDPFKNFARRFFPNAQLVADKFHVLRLLSPAINSYRKAITGDRRSLPIRRLLLRNGIDLMPAQRWALRTWLARYPELREVYECKEALHGFYRIRGPERAARALTALTDRMANSTVPEVQTFRRTLIKWRREVLAYFHTRLTNGPTEGFNNKAKLVKRRAYGYRSFSNYRLRLLNACA